MSRSVPFNITRYAISILLPLCLLGYPLIALATAFLLLLINNVLDDVSFYYASNEMNGRTMMPNGSPVNGIVTKIEYGVPLFSHIKKTDVLTKDDYLELRQLQSDCDSRHCAWNHITIFLDKFNHHVVINPSRVKSMKRLFADGRLEEMVFNGKLIPNESGEYVGNQAVIIEYEDMYAVLTLDKFVSRYLINSHEPYQVGINILRGSQCDLYSRYDINTALLKVGNVIQIGESVFKYALHEKVGVIRIGSAVSRCIEHIGGMKHILLSNIRKSFVTFRNAPLTLSIVVSILLSYTIHPLVYIAFASFYLFVFDRFYRHLMYAIMNAVGFKFYMQKSYSIIHKMSILWRMKN